MAFDKKQIALSVGGILAGLTLTYLLYRLQQKDAAAAQQSQANAASEASSQYALQQSQLASIPQISVPTISATAAAPAATDTTAPASSSALQAILTQILSEDQTPVTSQQSTHSTITALPFPTIQTADPNVPNPVQTFGSSGVTPISSNSGAPQQLIPVQGNTPVANPIPGGIHNDHRQLASLDSN